MIEMSDGRTIPDSIVELPYVVVLERSSSNAEKLPKAFQGSEGAVFNKRNFNKGV